MRKKSLEHCDVCGKDLFAFLFDHHHAWKVQRCVTCGLVQVIPRPTEKEVAHLYHEDFEHFQPYLDQMNVHRKYFNRKMSQIISLLSTKESQERTLLDIGCAMGVLLEEAKKRGFLATGIDLSADAAAYCKEHGFSAFHGTLTTFFRTHESKRFDVISGFEVIEHEYSPRAMVETMYKMLKKGGVAVATTPNYGSRWRAVMGKYWPGYQHPEHLFFFDPEALTYLFTDVGFSEVKVLHDENRPFPLSFLFTRAADYFPAFAPLLRFIGKLIDPLPLTNPINPWDDLIVLAKK